MVMGAPHVFHRPIKGGASLIGLIIRHSAMRGVLKQSENGCAHHIARIKKRDLRFNSIDSFYLI